MDKLPVKSAFEDVYQLEIYLHLLARHLGNKGHTACLSILKLGRSLTIGSAIVVKVDGRFIHINGFGHKFHAHFLVLCRCQQGRQRKDEQSAQKHEKSILLHIYWGIDFHYPFGYGARIRKARRALASFRAKTHGLTKRTLGNTRCDKRAERVRPNPRGRGNANNGRYSDLLPGSKRLPKRRFSDKCLRRQGQLTAAGLYGIFTCFPFKRHAGRTCC